MMNVLPIILVLLPIYISIPVLILYFIIKIAAKKAIKDENILQIVKCMIYILRHSSSWPMQNKGNFVIRSVC